MICYRLQEALPSVARAARIERQNFVKVRVDVDDCSGPRDRRGDIR
jgi:hypothetical protein